MYEKSRNSDQKGFNLFVLKFNVTMTNKQTYTSNSFQFQNHFLTFIVEYYSLLWATSVMS